MAKCSVFNRARPPRSVMVCGHKIKVKTVAKLVDGSQDLFGAYNGETKTIYLLKHPDWRSTLLHELIHCVLHLTGSGEGLPLSKEEAICVSLENSLCHFFF
jgi:Zn-dependent peptidase ImmA (M78 family)